jgi:hypothetical protein
VSETIVGKKTQFQAEPPERIKTYVERRKIELEEMEKRLEDMIPQMKSISRDSGTRPIVKYFEGKEGVASSNEELFSGDQKESTIYLLYPKDLVEELFTEQDRKKYRSIRIAKHIKSKVLYTSEKGERSSDATGDRIKIDGAKYPFSCDISIYQDRVIISVLEERLSSIFIRSKDFAETLKSLFNLAFDNLKK